MEDGVSLMCLKGSWLYVGENWLLEALVNYVCQETNWAEFWFVIDDWESSFMEVGLYIQRRKVDAAILQFQNQKLVQQLDSQKNEMHVLEGKFKELKEKQIAYNEALIVVNKLWNQLEDDLVLLGVLAGGSSDALQIIDQADLSRGSLPSCPPEEMFLCRLLRVDHIENNKEKGRIQYVKEALVSRHSSTLKLVKNVLEIIDVEHAKMESIASSLQGNPSPEGELEESMAELEETRRKLVNLQMQKEGASKLQFPVLSAMNGSKLVDKHADTTMGLQELNESIDEAKTLAATRLTELQEAQEDNLILSKQLEEFENEVKDDKHVISSRLCIILNDQLQHLNTEVERYKGLIETLQSDRNYTLRREKDLNAKADSADAVKTALNSAEARIKELELQLQKCIIERNELEIKAVEAEQDSGRKDIKEEIGVMASVLSKEMEMMETQLNKCKETACEAITLREEARNLEALLDRKTNEQKSLQDQCHEQVLEMRSLRAKIEVLQKEKQELQIFLDMYGQGCFDNRNIEEIKESERRAHLQVDILKTALDEHSLELRVKAANEAEAACQQRLSAAKEEISELMDKLDASKRDVLELTEAIKIKDAEAASYIFEIEAIGQAYEDMQTQNQHLLQQVTERDDFNIKLVSDSVKLKQTQSSLLYEKQAMSKQLQQVNSSLDFMKMRAARGEEQMKAFITQAAKVTMENRITATNLENTKQELAIAEKELKWLKARHESNEREYEHNQKKKAKLQIELEKERGVTQKMREELEEMKKRAEELSPENEEAIIQKLQDELKECKAMLKCGVCFDRPKQVLITKCYHLFCNPCIQRNLEIRHRKCPGCGTPFGHNDVQKVRRKGASIPTTLGGGRRAEKKRTLVLVGPCSNPNIHPH
ncbi:E3 ubiquitin-protein ligase BRE1-like 2 [Acorus gramineus]|uniref:E3 ubiquitin protein ligase n=1 Tax=Acorus gramineus TaxID=55184 RepID=A0AAV9BZ16_ACOGR|nr:E3 ubiquitin-protein ligase BRE1-like 2 [Acorus gramineus]